MTYKSHNNQSREACLHRDPARMSQLRTRIRRITRETELISLVVKAVKESNNCEGASLTFLEQFVQDNCSSDVVTATNFKQQLEIALKKAVVSGKLTKDGSLYKPKKVTFSGAGENDKKESSEKEETESVKPAHVQENYFLQSKESLLHNSWLKPVDIPENDQAHTCIKCNRKDGLLDQHNQASSSLSSKLCRDCKICFRCGGRNKPEELLVCKYCSFVVHMGCLCPPITASQGNENWCCCACLDRTDMQHKDRLLAGGILTSSRPSPMQNLCSPKVLTGFKEVNMKPPIQIPLKKQLYRRHAFSLGHSETSLSENSTPSLSDAVKSVKDVDTVSSQSSPNAEKVPASAEKDSPVDAIGSTGLDIVKPLVAKPKGLIDGLSKFFTPTNKRKSRVAISSLGNTLTMSELTSTVEPVIKSPPLSRKKQTCDQTLSSCTENKESAAKKQEKKVAPQTSSKSTEKRLTICEDKHGSKNTNKNSSNIEERTQNIEKHAVTSQESRSRSASNQTNKFNQQPRNNQIPYLTISSSSSFQSLSSPSSTASASSSATTTSEVSGLSKGAASAKLKNLSDGLSHLFTTNSESRKRNNRGNSPNSLPSKKARSGTIISDDAISAASTTDSSSAVSATSKPVINFSTGIFSENSSDAVATRELKTEPMRKKMNKNTKWCSSESNGSVDVQDNVHAIGLSSLSDAGSSSSSNKDHSLVIQSTDSVKNSYVKSDEDADNDSSSSSDDDVSVSSEKSVHEELFCSRNSNAGLKIAGSEDKTEVGAAEDTKVFSQVSVTDEDLEIYNKAREISSQVLGVNETETAFQKPMLIELGQYEIKTWYPSPYPQEFLRLPKLFLCEFCLKYMKSKKMLQRHMTKCPLTHPLAPEIYRCGDLSVFEVDGNTNKTFCQNLCLLSKFFLNHKTLHHDVEPFIFYVLTKNDAKGCHLVGYFSKEKQCQQRYNLSCIMVLPQYQRQGYGTFLIDFSYLLSRKEGRYGTPEKPLSELGLISYTSYWKTVILEHLRKHNTKKRLSIKSISKMTGISSFDVVSTLNSLNMLCRNESGRLTIIMNKQVINDYLAKTEAGNCKTKVLDPELLQWTPKYARTESCKKCRKEASRFKDRKKQLLNEKFKENRSDKVYNRMWYSKEKSKCVTCLLSRERDKKKLLKRKHKRKHLEKSLDASERIELEDSLSEPKQKKIKFSKFHSSSVDSSEDSEDYIRFTSARIKSLTKKLLKKHKLKKHKKNKALKLKKDLARNIAQGDNKALVKVHEFLKKSGRLDTECQKKLIKHKHLKKEKVKKLKKKVKSRTNNVSENIKDKKKHKMRGKKNSKSSSLSEKESVSPPPLLPAVSADDDSIDIEVSSPECEMSPPRLQALVTETCIARNEVVTAIKKKKTVKKFVGKLQKYEKKKHQQSSSDTSQNVTEIIETVEEETPCILEVEDLLQTVEEDIVSQEDQNILVNETCSEAIEVVVAIAEEAMCEVPIVDTELVQADVVVVREEEENEVGEEQHVEDKFFDNLTVLQVEPVVPSSENTTLCEKTDILLMEEQKTDSQIPVEEPLIPDEMHTSNASHEIQDVVGIDEECEDRDDLQTNEFQTIQTCCIEEEETPTSDQIPEEYSAQRMDESVPEIPSMESSFDVTESDLVAVQDIPLSDELKMEEENEVREAVETINDQMERPSSIDMPLTPITPQTPGSNQSRGLHHVSPYHSNYSLNSTTGTMSESSSNMDLPDVDSVTVNEVGDVSDCRYQSEETYDDNMHNEPGSVAQMASDHYADEMADQMQHSENLVDVSQMSQPIISSPPSPTGTMMSKHTPTSQDMSSMGVYTPDSSTNSGYNSVEIDVCQLGLESPTSVCSSEMAQNSVEPPQSTPTPQPYPDCAQLPSNNSNMASYCQQNTPVSETCQNSARNAMVAAAAAAQAAVAQAQAQAHHISSGNSCANAVPSRKSHSHTSTSQRTNRSQATAAAGASIIQSSMVSVNATAVNALFVGPAPNANNSYMNAVNMTVPCSNASASATPIAGSYMVGVPVATVIQPQSAAAFAAVTMQNHHTLQPQQQHFTVANHPTATINGAMQRLTHVGVAPAPAAQSSCSVSSVPSGFHIQSPSYTYTPTPTPTPTPNTPSQIGTSCSLAKLQQLTNGIMDIVPNPACNTMTPPPNMTPPSPHVNMTPPPQMQRTLQPAMSNLQPAMSNLQPQIPMAPNTHGYGKYHFHHRQMQRNPNMAISPNLVASYQTLNGVGYRIQQAPTAAAMLNTGYITNASFINQAQLPPAAAVPMGMVNVNMHGQTPYQESLQSTRPQNAMYTTYSYHISGGLQPQPLNPIMRR